MFGLLVFELWVARAKQPIGNIGVDAFLFQVGVVGFIGVTRVGCHDNTVGVHILADPHAMIARFHRFKHRLQCVVFLAFAKGLGIDNDLVLLVDGRDAVVTLNRALAGGHLGRLIVSDIAFYFLRPFTLPRPWGCCL